MLNPNLESALYCVQKPGRYIGGEYGQILKDKNCLSEKVNVLIDDMGFAKSVSAVNFRYNRYDLTFGTACIFVNIG